MKSLGKTEQIWSFVKVKCLILYLVICNIGESVKIEYCNSSTYYFLLWTKKSIPICLYCTKFGQLILRNIIKIVATRCQILRLNASDSISAGGPRWGNLQCSPDPLAGFKGPTSNGRGWEGKRTTECSPTPNLPLHHWIYHLHCITRAKSVVIRCILWH